MRSVIDIYADALPEVLPFLMASAAIVGSAQSGASGVVSFVIEGAAVPDAPRVTGTVKRRSMADGAPLTMTFQAA